MEYVFVYEWEVYFKKFTWDVLKILKVDDDTKVLHGVGT